MCRFGHIAAQAFAAVACVDRELCASARVRGVEAARTRLWKAGPRLQLSGDPQPTPTDGDAAFSCKGWEAFRASRGEGCERASQPGRQHAPITNNNSLSINYGYDNALEQP